MRLAIARTMNQVSFVVITLYIAIKNTIPQRIAAASKSIANHPPPELTVGKTDVELCGDEIVEDLSEAVVLSVLVIDVVFIIPNVELVGKDALPSEPPIPIHM